MPSLNILNNIILTSFFLSLLISCEKPEDDGVLCFPIESSTCPGSAAVNNELFNKGSVDFVYLDTLEMVRYCLNVRYFTGGCPTSQVKLIASDEVIYSDPPERKLLLAKDSIGDLYCLVDEIQSFNLEPLLIGNKTLFTLITKEYVFNNGKYESQYIENQVLYEACFID